MAQTAMAIDQYSDGDEEEEIGLVQRPPALLGLRFRDDEDREVVRRVSFASISLVVLSVFLFLLNIHHKGHPSEALGHLIMSLILPLVGYMGVKRESPRFIWAFHLGNVQFAILHAAVACLLLSMVLRIEATSSVEVCQRFDPHIMRGVGESAAQMRADSAALHQIYNACLEEVREKKAHAPWKLFWWGIMTTPLWACMIYAAYQAHEYYFRLRIRGLMARTGEAGGGTATIVERDPLRSDAIE